MKVTRIIAFIVLLSLSIPVFAMLPPSYLSVYRWKSCVSSYMRGSAELVCLPDQKPLECPYSSWKELRRYSNLPFCPRHHHHHHSHHDYDDEMGSSGVIEPIGSSSGSVGSAAPLQ